MGLQEVGVGYHVGQVRSINQDSLAVLVPGEGDQGGMLMVADGMGGHQGGQIASSRVISDLTQWFQSPELQPWLHGILSQHLPAALTKALQDQLRASNQALFEWGQHNRELTQMGTTMTVVWFYQDLLVGAHVGDSRVYLWRRGQLYHLTSDHSWIAEQVRLGLMSEAEAQRDGRRNRLLRALGTRPKVEIDTLAHTLEGGDLLLLCSDGLTAYFGDSELAQILLTRTGQPLQALCDQLIDGVQARGGGDNASVILARLSPVPSSTDHHIAMVRRAISPAYEEQIATVNLPAIDSPAGTAPTRHLIWLTASLLVWGIAVLLMALPFVPSLDIRWHGFLRVGALVLLLLSAFFFSLIHYATREPDSTSIVSFES